MLDSQYFDMLPYFEPTIPNKLRETRSEPLVLRLLCVHHQPNPVGSLPALQTLRQLALDHQIPPPHVHLAPPTPLPITVHKHRRWNSLAPHIPPLSHAH
jgi:hypothetical protein